MVADHRRWIGEDPRHRPEFTLHHVQGLADVIFVEFRGNRRCGLQKR
jgi:hypothetical protein